MLACAPVSFPKYSSCDLAPVLRVPRYPVSPCAVLTHHIGLLWQVTLSCCTRCQLCYKYNHYILGFIPLVLI